MLYHFSDRGGTPMHVRYTIRESNWDTKLQTFWSVQLMFSKWIVVLATVKCYPKVHGICLWEMLVKTNST